MHLERIPEAPRRQGIHGRAGIDVVVADQAVAGTDPSCCPHDEDEGDDATAQLKHAVTSARGRATMR